VGHNRDQIRSAVINAGGGMTRIKLAATLLLMAFLSGAASARRQSPKPANQDLPRFVNSANVVVVQVTATDSHGRHVPGLTKNDFQVLEDGVKQDFSFDVQSMPLRVVLAVDVSDSMLQTLPMAKAAASQFVQMMLPDDMVELVQFNTSVRVAQPLTSDRQLLEGALARLSVSGATALFNALDTALNHVRAVPKTGTPVRKAVVVLSDGDDTASLYSAADVLSLARRVDTPVFAIRVTRTEPRREDEEAPGAITLSQLATETGGRFRLGRANQLRDFYAEISDELHKQYVLGYVPANAALDGKWRTITVQLANKKGVHLRYRPGYYASRTRT